MQPKAKEKAEVAKQSKTTATAMQAVARPFKPITAWLTSQAAAKMAASPDMAGDADLQATAGMAASPDMVEDITEQPRVCPVVPVSKCSHQRSKRRDRRYV